jgi:signal transduction histidine kinase
VAQREANDRNVHVVMRDDGPGFDVARAAQRGPFGLQTMKERAESVGGRLVIESRPGAGTRLDLTVPTDGARAA